MFSDRSGGPLRLRFTVVDPSRVGAVADVLVTAPPGALTAAVHDRLVASAGARSARPGLHVDGVPADGAVLGLPPLLDGAILTVGRPGGSRGRAAGTTGGLLELHAVAGPDAGGRAGLPAGATRIGRCAEVGVRLGDPDVSRVHAEVVNDAGRVQVIDLGSTNGTTVDGRPVGSDPVTLPPGGVLRVGGSSLVLRAPDGAGEAGGGPASTHPDGRGHLLVNTRPRLLPPLPADRVEFPKPPAAPLPARAPWLATLLPLVIALPIAWWLRQPTVLAFALLSPLVVFAQQLSDRRGRRAERHQAAAAFERARSEATDRLAARLQAEVARRRLEHPDLAAVAAAAAGPLERIWERRPGDRDHLLLRLGLGDADADVTVHGEAPGPVPPRLSEVPIPVDLGRLGVVGVAGVRAAALGLVRALVGQAACWHSPRDLRIVVASSARDGATSDWGWTAWLPHADGALPVPAAPVDRPYAVPVPDLGAGPAVTGPLVLVVLDGAERLRRDPRVAAVLAHGPASGVRVLCLENDPARLPAECAATAVLGGAGEGVLAVRGERHQEFRPDRAGPGWAERLGRDLARLADATPTDDDRGVPATVRLLDLLARPGPGAGAGVDATDPHRTAAGWAARRAAGEPATTTPVGATASGPWVLDLRRDGPHVLVAGTTGAGKSELLTSLVAGLAARHSPQSLHLLLVDYKGGTAFGALADLPHVTGVITDLDAHLARRALTSLRAELRRRESLLRAAGAADLDEYERRPAGTTPAPARLVIVVDEFRVLAEELPDLLSGLVRVAAVGRSLGVHLVLATQRPAGAVSAEIRANVNLRIALRVRDRSDSDDVVEAPDAAALPADRPGRGLFRVGGGGLVDFQAARATGGPVGTDLRARVHRLLPVAGVPSALLAGPAAEGGRAPGSDQAGRGDDLHRLVAAARQAARLSGTTPAAPPWLPPLPARIGPDDVAALDPGPAGSTFSFGMVDLPEQQCRGRLSWDLAAQGHLAVVGAPGSGRTGTLRAIAAALSRGPLPVHLHVIDGGGRWADLAGAAAAAPVAAVGAVGAVGAFGTVGTVVPVADTERVGRLLSHLLTCARATAPGHSRPPVVLLVDGWEQALDAWYPVEHGRLVEDLLRLARDGAGAGVRLAVAGGRGLLSGPLAGLLTERLLLRAADPTDLLLAGVCAADLPGEMPPGRALRLLPAGRVLQAQVALDDPTALQAPAPTGGIGSGGIWSGAGAGAGAGPLRLRALPEHLPMADLLAAAGSSAAGPGRAAAAAGSLPIGLGGDDPAPVGPPGAGVGWLVAGHPGSGRSTALTVAGRVLLAAGHPVLVIADDHSPPAGLTAHGALLVPTAAAIDGVDVAAALAERPELTLIVDDAAAMLGTTLEQVVLHWLDRRGGRAGDPGCGPAATGPHLLAGSTPPEAALAFRGLLARLRAERCGLLTGAVGPSDGEAFGVRLAARPAGPPGRALLVLPGRTVAVQVADPA